MLVAALRPTVTAAGCTSLAAGTKALALCDCIDEKGGRERGRVEEGGQERQGGMEVDGRPIMHTFSSGWLRPPFPLSSHASSLSSRALHRADTNDLLSTLPPSTLAVCLGLGRRQKESSTYQGHEGDDGGEQEGGRAGHCED